MPNNPNSSVSLPNAYQGSIVLNYLMDGDHYIVGCIVEVRLDDVLHTAEGDQELGPLASRDFPSAQRQ